MEAIETDAPAPENHGERVQAVSELIRGNDDAKPSESASDRGGDTVPADTDGGTDSGSGELDVSQSDTDTGVHDDPETSPVAVDEETITVKGLAAHLDIEPSELYELEIPMAEGETISLGALKDEYKKYGDASKREETLKEADAKYHRQVLSTRAELNSILSVIPENIRAQVLQQGQQASAQWTKDQETLVLETIPDWQDTDKRAADRESIVSMGSEYGFSEPEMTYTQDARTLLMLRDFAQARKEISEMKAAAKKVPGKANAPGKTRTTTQSKRKLAASLQRAKQSKHQGDKVGAISQLIRQT